MNTDPQQIRAEVDAALAGLPDFDPQAETDRVDISDALPDGVDVIDALPDRVDVIDAVGRRLEHAHQILVDALESVEKG